MMNESNIFYRFFINFCVMITVGFAVLLTECSIVGEKSVNLNILWYIVVSGVLVSLVFETLFVSIFPLSGNHLRRNILWRNRLICAGVNALIITVLGKLMLGLGVRLMMLLAGTVILCAAAVIIGEIVANLQSRISIREMNRRLKQIGEISDPAMLDSEESPEDGKTEPEPGEPESNP